jgi:hypothetical protein
MLHEKNAWSDGLDEIGKEVGQTETSEPAVEYQGRPMDFAVDILGERRETYVWSENRGYGSHQWDGDVDPFAAAFEAIARWENVGVPGGIGLGKTRWLACLVLYFVGCHENAIVATCAPRRTQLLKRVWKEIRVLWPAFHARFPHARLMDSGEIRMAPGASSEWCAYADVAATRAGEVSTTRVQGEHAQYLLIISEETPGIAPAHMEAFKNTCTGPYNIQVAVGNPDYTGDQLAEFCHRAGVTHIRASCLDHPNVVMRDDSFIPGATTRDWVDKRWSEWHDRMPHMYDSRVRGLFPDVAIGAVYEYRKDRHTGPWDYEAVKELARAGELTIVVGIDTGIWRFATCIAALDSAERLHVFKELWSSQETTDTRMQALVDELQGLGVPPEMVRIWHDPGGGVDTLDLQAAMKRCGWDGKNVQAGDKTSLRGTDNQRVRYRVASYQRVGDLMDRGQLLLAPDLSEGLEWHIGASAKQKGTSRRGSRLIWELKNLRYEEPKEGRSQRDEPSEASADGADMLAALRFIAMTVKPRHRPLTTSEVQDMDRRELELSEDLARPAPTGGARSLPPDRDGNRDYGLERITAIRERALVNSHPAARKLYRKKMRQKAAQERRAKERSRQDRAALIDAEAANRQKDDAVLGAIGGLAELVDLINDGHLTLDQASRALLGEPDD